MILRSWVTKSGWLINLHMALTARKWGYTTFSFLSDNSLPRWNTTVPFLHSTATPQGASQPQVVKSTYFSNFERKKWQRGNVLSRNTRGTGNEGINFADRAKG